MLCHRELGDAFGMEHHARGPAVVGGRNRNADRDLLFSWAWATPVSAIMATAATPSSPLRMFLSP